MHTANSSFTNKDKLNINKHDKVFFRGATHRKQRDVPAQGFDGRNQPGSK